MSLDLSSGYNGRTTHSVPPANGNIFVSSAALAVSYETWDCFYFIARLEIASEESTSCGAPLYTSKDYEKFYNIQSTIYRGSDRG